MRRASFGSNYTSGVIDAAPTTYVVVCRGPNCRERGGLPLRKRLVQLLKNDPRARLVGYACFGLCDYGPNVAFIPEGEWYGGMVAPDAAERIVSHATCGAALSAQPLCLAEAERGEHLRNIAELIATFERDQRSPRHSWWPF